MLQAAAIGPPPADWRTDPWYTLWSSLCHQSDVYPASYAAVPELVEIASRRVDGVRWEALHLAACIELERHEAKAPECPSHLLSALQEAVQRAAAGVAAWPVPTDPDDEERRRIAEAVFTGRLQAARDLLDAD